ncbi:MAG: RNA polymerase sigma factor [Acidobacteriota bacterium]
MAEDGRESIGGIVADIRIGLIRAVQARFSFLRPDEVEDFVQEALMRMTQKLREDADEIENPFAFAKKTACNLVIDEIRRRQCLAPVPLPNSTGDLPPSREHDPERHLTLKQAHDAIYKCLERLNEARRIAVFLRLREHSVKEIGAMLDWPNKKVENLVLRGRSDLASCLRKKGVQGASR